MGEYEMKILAIDTSTRRLSVAVTQGATLLGARYFRPRRDLALSMAADLKRVLGIAGVALNDVDAFVIGLGPGSFTGLRVGLSGVKALALATGKPVIGLSSLDAVAMNIRMGRKDLQICVVTDARRNLVYSALYDRTSAGLVRKGEYRLDSIAAVLGGLSGQVVFTGDGLMVFQDEIIKESASGRFIPVFAPERCWYPRAVSLAVLGYERLRQGQVGPSAEMLVPLYLYPEDCQVGKEKPGKAG